MSISSALSGLSTTCQSSLTSLVSSNFATCADVIQLASIATSSGSIVGPLNTYISSICTATPCSSSDLSSANSTIASGCSSDISKGELVPTVLQLVVENYGGARDLLCTKYTGNGTYCVTEILTNAQTATGTNISISSLEGLVNGNNAATFLDSVPAGVYCTDCGHAISTEALKIVANTSSAIESTVSSSISSKCGSSFVDGMIPSDVSTTDTSGSGSSSTSSNSNDASRLGSVKTLTLLGTITVALLGANMAL